MLHSTPPCADQRYLQPVPFAEEAGVQHRQFRRKPDSVAIHLISFAEPRFALIFITTLLWKILRETLRALHCVVRTKPVNQRRQTISVRPRAIVNLVEEVITRATVDKLRQR